MRYNKLLKLLLCMLMATLLCTCAAMAEEEELFSARVELYTEGAFPEETPVLYTTFGMESFDSYMIEQLNTWVMTAYPEAIVGTYDYNEWNDKWPELFPVKPKISVADFGLNKDEIYIEYQRLLNAHPELFYVYGAFQYSENSEGIVQSLYPMVNYVGDELTELQAIYDSGVSAIVNYAKKADNDVARMLRASDYMCANFQYDTNYEIYSPELLFQKGTGVCQAYMLAYRAVLNELGIDNITVSSDEINHTWNMVYLDGSWYHIDVTWNDPLNDVPLRAYHTNFLLSDDGITATGHEGWDDSWEVAVPADNTKYDTYWWTSVRHAISMVGDVGYYVYSDYSSTERDICAYDFDSETTTVVQTFNYGNNGYYKSFYPPVWATADAFYYAVMDKLYAVPVEGGNAELIYTTSASDLWIWHPFLESSSATGASLKVYVTSHPQVASGSVDSIRLASVRDLTLDQTTVILEQDEGTALTATLTPEPEREYTIKWTSSDETVVTVDAEGALQAVGAGTATITALYDDLTLTECDVVVRSADRLCLPMDTQSIDAEAFAGTTFAEAELPEGVTTIGSMAFANNEQLIVMCLPGSLTEIAEDAFSNCPNLVLVCAADSVGEAFAIAQEIPYIIMP